MNNTTTKKLEKMLQYSNPFRVGDDEVNLLSLDLTTNALQSKKLSSKKSSKALMEMIRDRLFYISHPSSSSLECSINLKLKKNILKVLIEEDLIFEEIIKEILLLADFNPKQIEKKYKTQTILFKDVAALKLLNIIFKNNEDHALYPIYSKWIDGFEWMKN